ncbi:MAG: TonB-dependent receptor [Alphaproteobacteria bacterium]|nr:TonB-dependent receptor [Alphaproteobacteria bacterium]
MKNKRFLASAAISASILLYAPIAIAQPHSTASANSITSQPNYQSEARRILLDNVRHVTQQNPALKDSVGDKALLMAVKLSVQQKPHLAEEIKRVARGLKPQLAPQISRTAAQITGIDEEVPEWALSRDPNASQVYSAAPEKDIFALGLEELMNTKVVTASKSKERAFDVPAAISVITNEDIRRSGQTSVMEVLRMVPGMQVSRINSSGWAISARGFADEYANKMLVLIDGRSIYTPTFSGTYWDLVNLPLEDIDRIEVIRGPGASVWGANAVNGVINIVTKESKYTQGAYVSGGVGNHERGFAEGRVGGTFGKEGHYRLYSRYLNRDRMEAPSGEEQQNGWWRLLTGVRADWNDGDRDRFTVQGEIQHGANEQESVQFGPGGGESEITSSYLRGQWVRALESGNTLNISSFVDQHSRDTPILEQRVTTFDVDFNLTSRWMDRNELIWGGGYRLMDDSYGSTPVLTFVPSEEQKNLFSAFVQNKFEATKQLDLTLGTKFEHNGYTGFEVQPTAKVAYRPSERSTAWASVARAVRSPSRTEDSIRYSFLQQPAATSATVVGIGSSSVESEELVAYEIGYRVSPREGLVFDVATYFNDYDNLTSLSQGAPTLGGGGVIIPLNVQNMGEAEMYGIEATASWQVTASWLLSGYYSYGRLETQSQGNSQLFQDYESLWPEHSFSVRSLYNINENIEFDTALYYVSDLNNARDVNGVLMPVDSYVKWDVRLGWRPWEGLELSLVGLNLLEGNHQEFVNSRFYPASQIGRSYYGKATWRF